MRIAESTTGGTEIPQDSDVCYKIPPDFVSRASGTDALVLLSVWSNPYISIVGVTEHAVSNIAKYIQLPEQDVENALHRLNEVGEVIFDPDTQETMAPEWVKYNLPSN